MDPISKNLGSSCFKIPIKSVAIKLFFSVYEERKYKIFCLFPSIFIINETKKLKILLGNYFSGPATKRGGGALRKNNFLRSSKKKSRKNVATKLERGWVGVRPLVAGPPFFLRLP